MNEFNRFLIVLVSAVLIVLMAIVIFLTWSSSADVIEELADFVDFLARNNDTAGKMIVTLGALTISVLALLMIIVEMAPEDEPKELRVDQAGATTVIPADALRLRLEEALLGVPEVTAARTRVSTKDGGIASILELTVTPQANLAEVTQNATRVVVDTVQSDLGLPVAGVPTVKFAFGGSKAAVSPAPPAPLEPSPAVMAPIDPSPSSTDGSGAFAPPPETVAVAPDEPVQEAAAGSGESAQPSTEPDGPAPEGAVAPVSEETPEVAETPVAEGPATDAETPPADEKRDDQPAW